MSNIRSGETQSHLQPQSADECEYHKDDHGHRSPIQSVVEYGVTEFVIITVGSNDESKNPQWKHPAQCTNECTGNTGSFIDLCGDVSAGNTIEQFDINKQRQQSTKNDQHISDVIDALYIEKYGNDHRSNRRPNTFTKCFRQCRLLPLQQQ